MAKINTYSVKGVKGESINFPTDLVEKENDALLAQAIRVYVSRQHGKESKTKTRGEVNKTTQKVWRQKGTGRARHGARSAPIFVGGGKAHGPKGVSRVLTLPKKMKRKALAVAFGRMLNAKKMIAVKNIESLKKAKDANILIKSVIKKELGDLKVNKIVVALGSDNIKSKKILGNLKNVEIVSFNTLNAYKVYFSDFLVIDASALTKKKEVKK